MSSITDKPNVDKRSNSQLLVEVVDNVKSQGRPKTQNLISRNIESSNSLNNVAVLCPSRLVVQGQGPEGQGPISMKVQGQGPEGQGPIRMEVEGQGPVSTEVRGQGPSCLVEIEEIDCSGHVMNQVEVQSKTIPVATFVKEIPTWRKFCMKSEVDGATKWEGSEKLSDKVSLWKGDITTLAVDVVVNAANTRLLDGDGVNGAIHRVAGPKLREECASLGGCGVGRVKTTSGYNLPAKFIFHTVGPWSGDELLAECYRHSLGQMKEQGLRTIAFPCISTGVFEFPQERAAGIALDVVKEFLDKNKDEAERIVFCLYLDEDVEIYQKLMAERFGSAVSLETPEHLTEETLIRREVPYIAGVYIEGMINGTDVNITVDTGATRTLLSHATYQKIDVAVRPELHPCKLPAVADGRSMKTFGSGLFEVDLGVLTLEKDMVVVEMGDEVLLGADVIQFDPGGPADLLLSQDVLLFRGKRIPVLQIGAPDKIRRARSADHNI